MQYKLKPLSIILVIMLALIGTLTAIMTWVNLLPTQNFIEAWTNALTFAFLVMLPFGAVSFYTINKLIKRFFLSWSTTQKNLLQGVMMAIIIESAMAIVTVVSNFNVELNAHYLQLIFNSLLYALPVGLCFSIVMTLVVKPKVEAHLTRAC
ncbi:hypothetical protein [Thalassotalea sp. PLHSN55]|uniref:hypothetical protein n=1 Tax=Thalassotalea sp. PLHSN55 TaxID=3435888 RepID=UPI003F82AFF9